MCYETQEQLVESEVCVDERSKTSLPFLCLDDDKN